MRVLLTGATGFVGCEVARELTRRGHDVHALVMEGEAEERAFRERLSGIPLTRIRGNLLEPASYRAALEALSPDACIHAAWYANPKDYLSSPVNVDLLAASAGLMKTLVELGCRRIVGVGTCFEYDTGVGILAETTSPLRPEHLYSTCKRALFDVVSSLVRGTGTTFAWTRLFWMYGPHEYPSRLVPAVIRPLLAGEQARVSTGEQQRDFLHVADAGAGIVQVLESELTGPVNVASGNAVRVRDVVLAIARAIGGDAEKRIAWGALPARPNDPSLVCADVTKLASTGFRPAFDLESGLRRTVEWTKESR
jgi:nucleoside-diphosphate-sugar epimerase